MTAQDRSEGGDRARLFVALEVPEEVRDTLVGWRAAALEEVERVRLVPPEYLHLTLCFLGSRQLSEVDGIAAACRLLAGRALPELRVGGALWLPRRRPRVLAVALSDPSGALAGAQAVLADALADGGWYQPEQRPFLAHVTVARVGRGARVPREAPAAPPAVALRAPSVTLYRSHLRREGARYEALARVVLAGQVGEAAVE